MDICGVVFPITEKHLELLKKRKNPIYVKYLAHSKSTVLKEGNSVLFYVARSKKYVSSYSKIKKINFLKPEEIICKELSRIQMNREDFEKYTSNRKEKPLIILELDDIKDFNPPIILDFPITMTGKNLTKEELDRIIKK